VAAHHYLNNRYKYLIPNNGSDSLLYVYSNNQGSLIALTDVNGNVVEKYAYDPWGARRSPIDWTQKDSRISFIINRGYTGHEHLDAFGIINMNGRVYDPATGMFMSPDPYVQAPKDWLNYNRYSYCMGNPFKYTDPTGNTFWFFRLIFGAVGLVGDLLSIPIRVIATGIGLISGDQNVWKNVWGGNTWNCVNGWNSGKQMDESIFGKPNPNQDAITGEQTEYGTLYSWSAREDGQMKNFKYYKFDDIKTMVNFMWETSVKEGIEIAGYVLTDEKGNTTYYVLDWKNGYNDATHSRNPYTTDQKNGRSMFDGKYIAAEIHTHPGVNKSQNYYDGPSFKDFETATQLKVPVYSIGYTGVSVVTSKGIIDANGISTYTTKAEYEELGKYHYDITDLTIDGRRSVNPFYITDRISWLAYPQLNNSIFP